MVRKVALLATGDELVNGDILNQNSPYMAQRLFEAGITVGQHVVVDDQQAEIVKCLHWLLESHDAVITTGGLGPTSDDRTRYAIAEVAQQELTFDQATWDSIEKRLIHFGLSTLPEANKQQAYFPESARIIHNPNGTAAGCITPCGEQFIYMLPGPPKECNPMFDTHVLPHLIEQQFAHPHFFQKWLLFGVSEGHMAHAIEQALKDNTVRTGYRFHTPYLEFKLFADTQSDLDQAIEQVLPLIESHVMNQHHTPATELLKHHLQNLSEPWIIDDRATGGQLLSRIAHPNLIQNPSQAHIIIDGLNEYWKQNPHAKKETELTITFNDNEPPQTVRVTLPLRDERTLIYAAELAAQAILDQKK